MNRYSFYTVFRLDFNTKLLYTIYPTSINGLYYAAGTPITPGLSFGGLNLYNYLGRDVAANWTPNSLLPTVLPKTLTIVGFY